MPVDDWSAEIFFGWQDVVLLALMVVAIVGISWSREMDRALHVEDLPAWTVESDYFHWVAWREINSSYALIQQSSTVCSHDACEMQMFGVVHQGDTVTIYAAGTAPAIHPD